MESGSLYWRPAHSDFVIGYDNEASKPLVNWLALKCLFQTF
jgi:hypothetical protein